MKKNEKIKAEENQLQGELLDEETLDSVSGGAGRVTTAVHRNTDVARTATTLVQRGTGVGKLADTTIQRTPVGARDKEGDFSPASTRKGGRIVSC